MLSRQFIYMCVVVYITCTFCHWVLLNETICIHLALNWQGVLTMKVGEHSLSQFYQSDILRQISLLYFLSHQSHIYDPSLTPKMTCINFRVLVVSYATFSTLLLLVLIIYSPQFCLKCIPLMFKVNHDISCVA